MRDRRSSLCGVLAVLAVGWCTAAAHADHIRLKASVRLDDRAACVRLADIADLKGDEAAQYADLVVLDMAGQTAPLEIPIRRVRAALDEAGAHWGRINLSGNTVIVRPGRPRMSAAPTAMQAASLLKRAASSGQDSDPETSAADDRLAATLVDAPSLRGVIARWMIEALHASPDRVRLRFDVTDAAFLDDANPVHRFELKPETSADSERVVFTVRVWEGGIVAVSRQIALRPLVTIDTAVLRRDIARHERIDEPDLEVQPKWMAPHLAALMCPPDVATGRVAGKRLRAGDVLRGKDVQRETLIERGDRVTVRCLVGGVVISLQAEACEHGAEGQTIEFRKLGERDQFRATVSGRGEAVIDLSQSARALVHQR